MSTTKDIIKQALRNIGVTASGEEPAAEELQDAYLIAQQMVDAWTLEKLLIPAVTHESFAVDTVGAAATYTIGTGGTLNTTRPIRIENIRYQDASGSETDIRVVGLEQWAGMNLRNQVSRPSYGYYEPSFPLGKLYLDTIPEAGYILKLVSHKPLTALPALNSVTAYPPGYDRCIRLNLEVELAPAFERPVNAMTVKLAKAAKSMIKRNNHTPLHSRADSALLKGDCYDIDSGP